ncbi:MAG: hypothetical protein QM831_15365 [Kofleriaceae bacterium]
MSNEVPYRELFVERRDEGPCPYCKWPMREIDEDGGVRCDHCGARSLPLEDRRAITRR